LVVEIGWRLPRIEVAGDIAGGGQSLPRAVESVMMMMMIVSLKMAEKDRKMCEVYHIFVYYCI
jgi:hypothetical protein